MSEEEIPKIIGTSKGPLYIMLKGKIYQSKSMKGFSTKTEEGTLDEFELTCILLENQKESKFSLKALDLTNVLISQIKAEEETGQPHLILMNFDLGTWKLVIIDDNLITLFPGFKPYLEEIKRKYIV